MNDIIPRLEFLPNEILIDIFQYFDARDLFRAFFNLNSRFNALLQSHKHLFLTLSKPGYEENDDYHAFSPYLHKLIINRRNDINLSRFINVRHLALLCPTSNQLKQLESNILPYLAHLSVGSEHLSCPDHTPNVCYKIFSNGFPHLKSCYLFIPSVIPIRLSMTPLIQLRILKVLYIDIGIYKSILSLCPNLYFLQFTILNPRAKLCYIESHKNLKQMIIKFEDFMKPLSDCDIDLYLSCVPNLKKLCIHRTNLDANINEYLKYKWLTSEIDRRLPLLHRFQSYLHVYRAEKLIENDNENILSKIEENFKLSHNDQYQSQLIFDLSPLPYLD